jgi:DNA (cytosine-5)-methyltransferase 1
MTVGSLFSGIGGLDLGFERAGFTISWMCEKAEYPRRVLAKHWPNVPIYDDVNALTNPPAVDVLIGGFPCQDISLAGKGAGLDGERSGLWWQYHRLIGEVRPRYAVVENVAALVVRGLPAVLGSLSELGYDAEWEALSSCMFGAPHTRERLFIVAYPNKFVARQCGRVEQREFRTEARDVGFWKGESEPVRVADVLPDRLDRNFALGNSVDPHVAEYVARCVRAHAEASGLWQGRVAA